MNLYLHCPCFVSDLVEIKNLKSPHVLFSCCKYYESHCSEIHIVLTDLNEMVPLFLVYSIHLGKKLMLSGGVYGEPVSFVKNGAVKAILYLMMSMNFCPSSSSSRR